ncbi:MAG TPA: hypothetical protein PK880_03155 [Candidatus Competibacter sp.]|nr:hypothetical protein [Candidatus Competibacter sp.]
MDEKEKDLLIEIHVAARDGRQKNFTGYPVAMGRILTARHGLLFDIPVDEKTIVLRWHELDPQDQRRGWRPAEVIWEDEPLDAALISASRTRQWRQSIGKVLRECRFSSNGALSG